MENGDGNCIWRAVITINVIVFYEAIAEEEATIISSSIAVHNLVSCVEFGYGCDDKGILLFFIFPDGLARSGVVDHVCQGNEKTVIQAAVGTAKVSTKW